MTVYQLNSIIFNNDVADVNGAKWFITEDIDGWDSPAVRSSVVEQPGVHGGITVEGLFAPRILTIRGVCKAGTTNGFFASKYYLQSQTARLRRVSGSPIYFTAQEEVNRRCEVVRHGLVSTRQRGGSTFEFNIVLRADDPLKYSTTEYSNSLVGGVGEVITNAGNFRMQPRFNTDEANTGHGLHNSTYGYDWTTHANIPDNTDIDFKAMTVLQGSTSYFDAVDAAAEWWFLEPGNNTVLSDQDTTIFWRDAWI